MSERTIYDGMDLANTMQEKIVEAEQALNDMQAYGIAWATAEHDYKILKKKEWIKLRDKGLSASAIEKLIYGIEEVAQARYLRDTSMHMFEVAQERINLSKLEIRIIENQMSREFGRGGQV